MGHIKLDVLFALILFKSNQPILIKSIFINLLILGVFFTFSYKLLLFENGLNGFKNQINTLNTRSIRYKLCHFKI